MTPTVPLFTSHDSDKRTVNIAENQRCTQVSRLRVFICLRNMSKADHNIPSPPFFTNTPQLLSEAPSTMAFGDIPVIDLSQFPQQPHHAQNHDEITKVRDACQKWGFFRVVNHGIPETLLQDMESAAQQLIAVPAEAKERSATAIPRESYTSRPGFESFTFMRLPHSDSVLQMSRKIWPQEGNQLFCKTVGTYTLLLADLALKITKTILASLDLDVEHFYESDFQNSTSRMRINHYTCDGKSVDEEAFFSHTDPVLFTVLYTGDEGGLQIRSKEGEWLNIKPLPNTFVINIGDCLQAWSNARYRSAEHRVVHKGWADRVSLAYFVEFPGDKEIWAPPELVDEQHPRRYRPFTITQLKSNFYNSVYSKEGKASVLDRYAAQSL